MKRSVSSHHAASRGSADSMFHSLIDDTVSPMGQVSCPRPANRCGLTYVEVAGAE